MISHELVDVTTLELLGGHRVRVSFSDGTECDRDLESLLTGPVFDRIRTDADAFAQVSIDPVRGVLCWPNGADIDSDLLRYDDLWNETTASAPAN